MLLLSTSTLTGYGLHRVFDFAKKAGYDGLDISLGIMNFDLWDGDYILSLTKLYNIPIRSITAPSKDMSTKKFQDILTLGKKLGVHSLSFAPPHIMDKDTKWFHTLSKAQKATDIHLCVHNVESTFLFFVIPEYRNASFEKIKSVTGNASLDILAVANSSQMDIMRALAVLGSSLKNVYIADRNTVTKGILPGTGEGGLSYIPLESFLMKLKAQSYSGDISLKVTAKEIGVGDAERVLEHLKAMKAYYIKHFM
ncbi:hypothetical protein LAT59_01745 [Candidatus Gracilibacteria bacterium]|nr:hypothetical protein [Candidatus Gracilibacteria bacterium]